MSELLYNGTRPVPVTGNRIGRTWTPQARSHHRTEEPRGIVQTVVAQELDDYAPSFGYKAVRRGLGSGPNVHRQIIFDGVCLQSGSIGFPTAGELTLPDDHLAIALSVCAPPGTLWSEHDFSAGTILSWGPGSEATWVNQQGASVQFAFVDRQAINSIAVMLKERVRLPSSGAVMCLPETTSVRRLRSLLASLGDPLDSSLELPHGPIELLVALTRVFADNARRPPAARGRRLDGRRLVRMCVDHADEVGARPSIPELCDAANVSERRLRQAFNDAFDMGPLAYFRLRSLNLARSKLLEPDPSTVTEVAYQLGWDHLGRFAHQYRQVFQEAPSQTRAKGRRPALTRLRSSVV